jgi:galactitol-specific phosphotransferase system IIC component
MSAQLTAADINALSTTVISTAAIGLKAQYTIATLAPACAVSQHALTIDANLAVGVKHVCAMVVVQGRTSALRCAASQIVKRTDTSVEVLTAGATYVGAICALSLEGQDRLPRKRLLRLYENQHLESQY